MKFIYELESNKILPFSDVFLIRNIIKNSKLTVNSPVKMTTNISIYTTTLTLKEELS